MSNFVLDASVSAEWFIPGPGLDYAIQVRQRLANGERALVPGLWSIEMASLLARAVRKGVFSPKEADQALGQLGILLISGPRIETDLTAPSAWQVYETAREFQLTAYDGCYLDLARREALPLATLDSGLQHAAGRAGVQLLSP